MTDPLDAAGFLKIEELKGADSNELRTQVDLLLFQAFPRRSISPVFHPDAVLFFIKAHPHTSLSLPAIETLSLNPILFAQVPALDNVLAKQISLPRRAHTVAQHWLLEGPSEEHDYEVVTTYLKPRFALSGTQTQRECPFGKSGHS
jgi:hypothetical protein